MESLCVDFVWSRGVVWTLSIEVRVLPHAKKKKQFFSMISRRALPFNVTRNQNKTLVCSVVSGRPLRVFGPGIGEKKNEKHLVCEKGRSAELDVGLRTWMPRERVRGKVFVCR